MYEKYEIYDNFPSYANYESCVSYVIYGQLTLLLSIHVILKDRFLNDAFQLSHANLNRLENGHCSSYASFKK